jgi:hypothetical protein
MFWSILLLAARPRFSRLVATAVFTAPVIAAAQITAVTTDQAPPIPGAAHDNINFLNETVNPASGSVSIRIKVPMPADRSLNLAFAFGYDSNAAHRYNPGDGVSIVTATTTVPGIFATKPGVIGRRQTLRKEEEELPMAMIGIVPTKVTTENGPIHRGDLLVTSSTIGYAMNGTDRSRLVGSVIGKAMGPLDVGEGAIEISVTLQ